MFFKVYMTYRNLFFDLDDTLWAFSENACDALEEVYHKHRYDRFFHSFGHFHALYQQRNLELWEAYGKGQVTKSELNRQRFLYPLEAVGAGDARLAQTFADDYFAIIPTRQKLMPHAREALEYLSARYNLYILSNGFRELQYRKMCSSGIGHYFRKVILSEDIGVLKPHPAIFHFALSATQSELSRTLMIGDNWENDIAGAAGVGMHQVFYDVSRRQDLPFRPTYRIADLSELMELL